MHQPPCEFDAELAGMEMSLTGRVRGDIQHCLEGYFAGRVQAGRCDANLTSAEERGVQYGGVDMLIRGS